MKYLKQLLIIFFLLFIGEFLNKVLNVPIPGNVIGMLLLSALLIIGLIKESQVSDLADFLLNNMLIMFIPIGVSIINAVSYLAEDWWKIILVIVLSTLVVFFITGQIIQMLIKKND